MLNDLNWLKNAALAFRWHFHELRFLVDLIRSCQNLSCQYLTHFVSPNPMMTRALTILCDRNRSLREMIGPVKCLLPAVKTKESEGPGVVCDGDGDLCSVYRRMTWLRLRRSDRCRSRSRYNLNIPQTSCHNQYNQRCTECWWSL